MDRKTLWSERAEKVINRVNAAFPNPDLFENWTICEELLLSATAAYQKINQFQIKTDNAVHIINKTARLFPHRQSRLPRSLNLIPNGISH